MFRPFAGAHAYVIWRDGMPYGGYIFTWKAAKKKADALCNDLFEHHQIEILDTDTGQIWTIQKGVKRRQ